MSSEYPPVSFYFRLNFSGASGRANASFKEVSGISMEMATEEITEGGNNEYKYRVPTSAKFSNLVLKRGLVSKNSDLVHWCSNILGGGLETTIKTKNIEVSLLDVKGHPLKTWNFANAWPVKWEVSNLHSLNNEILIETVEFAYSFFEEVTKGDDRLPNLFD